MHQRGGLNALRLLAPDVAVRDPSIGNQRPDRARVRQPAPGARAALHREPVLHARVDADVEALCALVQTPPATLAGVKALLRHIVECEEHGDPLADVYVEDGERTTAGNVLHRALLTALERLA